MRTPAFHGFATQALKRVPGRERLSEGCKVYCQSIGHPETSDFTRCLAYGFFDNIHAPT